MEFESTMISLVAKKLRNLLKLFFNMMRKRLIRKRRVDRSPSSLSFLPHSKYRNSNDFNAHAYEFSCSNTPNRVYLRVLNKNHQFFPCINHPKVVEYPDFELPGEVVFVSKTPEYELKAYYTPDRGISEKCSPIMSPSTVRISNFSSDDEGDEVDAKVDYKAEEFIRRFYEQLSVQY